MDKVALFGKALSDPTRIRIIAALRHGEVCVCELCDAMELSQSTLSNHLQVIRQAGLVTTRRDGKWIYYGIEPNQAPLVDALFTHHQAVLDADTRLQRDTERLQHRLQLREAGCCVVGFVPLSSLMTGGHDTIGGHDRR
jgi:ArsR family transcriptional regulator